MKRKLLVLVGVAVGWLVGLGLYRRTSGARRERVDVYFDDGSMLSVAEGTPEASRLLPLAREAVRAVRMG